MTTTSAGGGKDDRPGRIAITLLAGAGATETGFLTADKLWPTGALDSLCVPGGGCADVLSGPWSSVLGVPLAAVGLLAYTAIAILAALPLLRTATPADAADAAVAAETPPTDAGASALLLGTGALASFSLCLVLLLLLVLHESCVLCFTSAGLSASIFLVAWRTPLVGSRTDAAVLASSGGLISIAAAVSIFAAQSGSAGTGAATVADGGAPVAPPAIRSRSSERALQIATQLQSRGARFYGAYWCSHCRDQKEALGTEAMRLLPYYECDANGANSRRADCQAVGIKGYPTWELDGNLFPGERDLDDLELMLAGKAEPAGIAQAPN